jgi:hypothetical protein
MIWKRSDVSRRSAWTKADIQLARRAPLKPVLEKLGYRLEPSDNDNYLLTSLPQEIVIKDHYWICTETGSAGNAIDFFVRVKGMSFNEAMKLLTQPIQS